MRSRSRLLTLAAVVLSLALGTACGGGGSSEPVASCTDGVKNGTESDQDCGGSCGPCAADKRCAYDADCASGRCNTNGRCACSADADCESGLCLAGTHACGCQYDADCKGTACRLDGTCG